MLSPSATIHERSPGRWNHDLHRITSRPNDPRAAEQTGNLLIIPVLIFMLAGLFGYNYLSSPIFLLAAAAVAALDVALVYAGAALFQRETILNRWS